MTFSEGIFIARGPPDGGAEYGGPECGFIEQVFCLRLHADKNDRSLVMLRNGAKDRAVSMAFSIKELPCFTLWKNTTAEQDGYVTGLEPGTNFSYNRRIERKLGRVRKLAPAASHRVTMDVGILIGRDQVAAAAGRIARIQGDRKPTIDDKPPKLD